MLRPYRCTGSAPLTFACTAMPPWPGDDEAVLVDRPWTRCVDP
jgi:mannose-6-phosphate isomerase-like protein (cupin superfamily)